jgi:hypothetical protein
VLSEACRLERTESRRQGRADDDQWTSCGQLRIGSCVRGDSDRDALAEDVTPVVEASLDTRPGRSPDDDVAATMRGSANRPRPTQS